MNPKRLARIDSSYRLMIGAALTTALLSGCSIQHFVIDRAGDALAQGGKVYAGDDDIELVGAATPFGLKLMESLIAESPQHRGLLLAAARGFTQYAYAYVEMPADEIEASDVSAAYNGRERARKLYLRARDYGLRGLAVRHADFAQNLKRDQNVALSALQRDDAALLYWTAAAWGAAISLSKDDAAALANLPLVQRLSERALELDESFEEGAIHLLHLSLAMNQSRPEAERVAAARRHFDRAIELSAGQQAAAFVSYAETVSVPTANRREFDQMLERALQITTPPNSVRTLSNELFQKRARWLRSHVSQLFAE